MLPISNIFKQPHYELIGIIIAKMMDLKQVLELPLDHGCSTINKK
jgi:hypothetical protein